MPAEKRILVAGMGGTIASSSARGSDGVAPRLGAEELVAATGPLPEGIAIETADFARLPSPSLGLGELVALRAELAARTAAGVDGVVVTHGTSTMEESAYAMSLLWGGAEPVVFTGAMRNPTLAGPDGPANLRAAVIAAAEPELRDLGALVVFDGELYSPRYFRKVHANSTAPFASRETGPLGWISEDRCRLAARPVGRLRIEVPEGAAIPAVALLEAVYGDDGRLLDAVGDRYAGLVVAGMGPGHVPASWAEPLRALARRMPVLIASRTGAGEVYRSSYDFPGSDIALARDGVVAAGALDARKARIVLSLLLAAGHTGDAWREPLRWAALPREGTIVVRARTSGRE